MYDTRLQKQCAIEGYRLLISGGVVYFLVKLLWSSTLDINSIGTIP